MMTPEAKAMALQGNLEFARNWWKDLELTFDGVELGEAMEYDVLRVLGHQFFMADRLAALDAAKAEAQHDGA